MRREALALALTGTILCGGCGEEPQAQIQTPSVRVQEAGAGAAVQTAAYSGTVRGRYETKLSFQVGGRIVSRNVQEGSAVQAGDILMSIDARDVVQKANAGDAVVAEARAKLDLAQANLARYTELYNQEVVPQATLDMYQTDYDAAFAGYQSALAQSAEGHNALDYSDLTAGAAGVVSDIAVEEGQVVAAGQTVATLVRTDELEVEIAVPEDKLRTVQVGTPVEISFWALGDSLRVPGTVREVAPMADKATRTYLVRVSVPRPPQGMSLGMTAEVSFSGIAADTGTASRLPLTAIYQTGDSPTVWLVENGQVHLRAVKIVSYGEDNTVLVTGLEPHDLVVTAGVHKLQEGQAVRAEGAES